MTLLIILIIVLAAWVVFFSVQFYNLSFRGFAPFISSQPGVIRAVLKELELKPSAVVYELGCGQAGFLRALEQSGRNAKLIGVEYGLLPLLIAKIQAGFAKSKIELRHENLFKTEIGNADVIYCYLNDTMMEKLKDKFKKECRPGTLVISNTFSVPGWLPEKTVRAESSLQSKIYFYRV